MDEKLNKFLGSLIIKLANGDKLALETIYKIMCKILYTIGSSYFFQKADIEDAIHDLLVCLYEKSKLFKHNVNACAWIIRIFQNNVIKSLNLRRRQEVLDIDVFIDTFARSRVDEEYIERYVFLNGIFSHLTEYEKNLIIYKHWCGCTIREVAVILKKSKSAVQKGLLKVQQKVKSF